MNKSIVQNLKTWEYGLFKAAKIAPYWIILTLGNALLTLDRTWTPVTYIQLIIGYLANSTLVFLVHWAKAHMAVKTAPAVTQPTTSTTPPQV